jgi:hypothetical protein
MAGEIGQRVLTNLVPKDLLTWYQEIYFVPRDFLTNLVPRDLLTNLVPRDLLTNLVPRDILVCFVHSAGHFGTISFHHIILFLPKFSNFS